MAIHAYKVVVPVPLIMLVALSQAMERLTAGQVGLAALATDLGFADQAHLTRTVRKTWATRRPPCAAC
jgi:hypothetical protein